MEKENNINKISVVIVIFHSEKIIEKTIEYLLDQDVIIIDCANNIKLKNYFEKKYPKINYVLSKENLGYSAGNNLGIKLSKQENVLVLNPDALINDTSLKNLLNCINNIRNFGILCPNLGNAESLEFSKKINNFPTKVTWKAIGNNMISGCAFLMNKKILGRHLYFDEKIFIYKEDTDLIKRLNDLNISVYFLPNCSVNHTGTSSHNSVLDYQLGLSRNFHWPYGNVYFYKKHFGIIKVIQEWGFKYIKSLIKSLFYFLFFNIKYKIYFLRFLGISSALLGIKPWYRPKL